MMTDRYDLLIKSINDTNYFIVRLFLFALLLVIAYPVLDWTPAWMRRPAKFIYLAFLPVMFILSTISFQ